MFKISVLMNESDYILMFAFINYNSNSPIRIEEMTPYLSVKLRTNFIYIENLPAWKSHHLQRSWSN